MTEPEVIGDMWPPTRLTAGLWSFDKSFEFRGERGINLRSLVELYGPEASGKTTLGLFLLATLRPEGEIHVADLETTFDREYAQAVMKHAGFSGTLHVEKYIEEKKGKPGMVPHEKQVMDAIDSLVKDGVNGAMIDSVGMFYSALAASKDLGERTVGDRAKTIGDGSRRLLAWLRIVEQPKLLIMINHVHPNIGGGRGFSTPGGETKKFASNVRIWIRRLESDVPDGTGNFLAETKVQKLKVGSAHSGRKGLVYFVPGYGVHRGLTAVFDCIRLGLAKREATVKLNLLDMQDKEFKWTSTGRLSTLAKKYEDAKVFEDFHAALERYDEENK